MRPITNHVIVLGIAASSLVLFLQSACGSSNEGNATAQTGGPSTMDAGTAPPLDALDSGADAAPLGSGDLDPPSSGGTITFQSIGAPGWFPSRRDPATGPCDAYEASGCCLAKNEITSDALTPWDEDLILTLRGPMQVKQLVVYQPDMGGSGAWDLVSSWNSGSADSPQGMAFEGNGTDISGFQGTVGTECLVNVSTSEAFTCGAGSSPYCPAPATGKQDHYGWAGSKLFVMLATMPHADVVGSPCSKDNTGNWYDAPWLGLSVGELVRAGSYVSCQCYAKDPTNGALADGCGQFNVFEVVNDNNQYKNLDVFSTDMIDYAGYVGEGPCGPKCDVTKLAASVDLIDKSNDTAALAGAISTPTQGPGAAFRRPEAGYRYFLVLLDVATRTVQLGIVHPGQIPMSIAPMLPSFPATLEASTLDAIRGLRLPE